MQTYQYGQTACMTACMAAVTASEARQSSVHILIWHFLCDFVFAVREASWRPVMRHRLSHCHDKNVTHVNLQTLETSAQWSRGERNSWLIRPSLWAAWQHWDHQVIRRHEWQHCSLNAPETTSDQTETWWSDVSRMLMLTSLFFLFWDH